MSYPHQKETVTFTGATAAFPGSYYYILASLTAGVRGRYTGTHAYILRSMIVRCNTSVVTAGKPTFQLFKAVGGTTTATGTAVGGTTLTCPATTAKGTTMRRVFASGKNTVFEIGDVLILKNTTAATKAMAAVVSVEIEPTWESIANATAVTTVTG